MFSQQQSAPVFVQGSISGSRPFVSSSSSLPPMQTTTFVDFPPPPPVSFHSSHGSSSQQRFGPQYGPQYGHQEQEDPLKKVVLLSGMASGKINPLAAVAMDRNQGMSAMDTVLVSSMGNNGLTTALALSGGLGGSGSGSGSQSLFGNSRGGQNSMLQTMVLANALAPKNDDDDDDNNNDAFGSLATIALLSKTMGGHNDGGYGYDSHRGGFGF